jgi:hypothetical protein
VQREKFEFHNAQWLEIVKAQQGAERTVDTLYSEPDDDYFAQLVSTCLSFLMNFKKIFVSLF